MKRIIAVDDERLSLSASCRVLKEIFSEEEVFGFDSCGAAIEFLKKQVEAGETADYAFLDIEMRQMSGLELAKTIKQICPMTRILFVTAHDQYALEAFRMHAKGYILKPITKEMVEETLDSLETEWKTAQTEKKHVSIHTFGNFDIFVEKQPLKFERSKAKELLAYLIDRNGAGVTTTEISAVLWEDKEYDRNLKSQTQKVISAMMTALKNAGADDIIIKKWNYLAVDTSKIDCDFYRFLAGDVAAVNAYMGEYMTNYSWAELTTGTLDQKADTKNEKNY